MLFRLVCVLWWTDIYGQILLKKKKQKNFLELGCTQAEALKPRFNINIPSVHNLQDYDEKRSLSLGKMACVTFCVTHLIHTFFFNKFVFLLFLMSFHCVIIIQRP